MSLMTEKLRATLAIDPARAQMNLPAGNLKTHMCDD
jgi:hypothetical protein